MTETDERLASLREAFDRAFALPRALEDGDVERLLLLRVSEVAYAMRLHELSGLLEARPPHVPTPLPGGPPALAGLIGLRGKPVAVFELARLLGQPATPVAWIALSRGNEPFGLAFEGLEGYYEAPRTGLHAAPDALASSFVAEAVVVGGQPYGLLRLDALAAALAPIPGTPTP